MPKYDYVIGIDTGVNTGFAVWSVKEQKFTEISTLPIHVAMQKVQDISNTEYDVLVRFEDARQRKWFGKAGREQLQGAGSIKRDAGIWDAFLTDLGVTFDMVAPKNNKTKLTQETFKKLTGWDGRTSVHARDGAMMVFGYK